MGKTIKSVNLDDDIWKSIDNEMGDGATLSGWLNIHLKKYLMELKK